MASKESPKAEGKGFWRDPNNLELIQEILGKVWDMDKTSPVKTPFVDTTGKSETQAVNARMRGNYFFKLKNFEKALELYNASILIANHPVMDDEDVSILEGPTALDGDYAYPKVNPSKYGGYPKNKCKALAKGYANRSAVMLELNLYGHCIRDIDLAIESGYPKALVPKLEERRQICIEGELDADWSDDGESYYMKQTLKAQIAAKKNIKGQSVVHMKKLYKVMERIERPDLHLPSKRLLREQLIARPKRVPALKERNTKIPSLSSALNVTYTNHKGRSLVALRDINPGELLGVERAFCVGLKDDDLTRRCLNCLRVTFTPLPCPGCSLVVFCSEICRLRGLAEDHWVECKILPSILTMEMSFKTFSYKMLKTWSYHQLQTMIFNLKEEREGQDPSHQVSPKGKDGSQTHVSQQGQDNPTTESHQPKQDCLTTKVYQKGQDVSPTQAYPGSNNNGQFTSTSFRSIYYLNGDEFSFPDHLFRDECLFHYEIANLLKSSKRFFINDAGEPFNPTKEQLLQACKILIDNSGKKCLNAFLCQDGENECWGIFPTFSLINHSCNPNATANSCGRHMYLLALAPITAGEEITMSYTDSYEVLQKERRKECLKKFRFTCDCEACRENWPVYEDLPNLLLKCLICESPVSRRPFVCSSCVTQENRDVEQIKRRKSLGYEIDLAMEHVDHVSDKLLGEGPVTEEDFDVVCKLISVFYSHALPCKFLSSTKEMINSCYKACLREIR